MSSVSLEGLTSALIANSRPGQQPRDLLRSVRRKYPSATEHEVVRAAFYAMIDVAEDDPEKADCLQDFAIRARNGLVLG
jgi:hypothetical protein